MRLRIPRNVTLIVVAAAGFVAGAFATLYAVEGLFDDPFASDAAARPVETATASPLPTAVSASLDPVTEAPRTVAETAPRLPAESLEDALAELRGRRLEMPVVGIDPGELRDSFDDPRRDDRIHRAIDIMAPRWTPVIAVEDGTIGKLDGDQGGGGIVIYQYDPTRRFVYYYAHLQEWAAGLSEGEPVTRGQVIGYVGTTGNAPSGAPHLHFAVSRLGASGDRWDGEPINPFAVLR